MEVWAILHKQRIARGEANHGGSMCERFNLFHAMGADRTDDLELLEMRDSIMRCPGAWFLILHRCVDRGDRSRLVRDFRRACEQLLAAKVSPDLQDLLDPYVRSEDFYDVRVTEAQHRQAAMMSGLGSICYEVSSETAWRR